MKYKVKDINRLVYPILLNYLLNSIFEILDQAIVGHYSSQSFALVGIASSMIYAVTGAFGIMSTVFNIIAAERKGKRRVYPQRDSERTRRRIHGGKINFK